MSEPLLTTKFYIPPTRLEIVPRPRLIERLNGGLHRKLTLVSAPAGFGKTTLVTEWLDSVRVEAKEESQSENKVAWLSLDEDDNDPVRFLSYFITALNQIEGGGSTFGKEALGMLQSPQPPPTKGILTSLINEIAETPDRIIFILDDYHRADSTQVDDDLTFLLENLPPQMHLVFITREDPHLPLARLRSRNQLTELRSKDLRFTSSEAAEFLNHVMGLSLSEKDIAALETRTEGWIAGLQLAAISLQGQEDATSFIKSFTGSHRIVLDYLIEEVLEQQPESIQVFMLQTAILERLNGSLCDVLTGQDNGQQTLEYLEKTNLFIIPLDNERCWFRYHHLFADLLRQRLHQSLTSSAGDEVSGVAEIHIRASIWFEDNGLEIESLHHAAAANDIERAERLIEGDGLPLHFRGAAAPVLKWLASLPTTALDARPSLWVMYASASLINTQMTDVEKKLQAAEAALQSIEPDHKTQDLVGRIAATRATLAATQNHVETIIAQSHRALEYLHPDNLTFRTFVNLTLGYAYQLEGDRPAASQAYSEVISIGQSSGNIISTLSGITGLGYIQESENQLSLAAESYQEALQLAGDPPLLPTGSEAHLGLARIYYQWNDMNAAQRHGERSAQLAQQIDGVDTPVSCGVFLSRLKLAQGDVAGAAAILAEADQLVRQHNFVHMLPEVTAAQVLVLLYQGNLAAASHLAEKQELPFSQARVYLAQGETSAALEVLVPLRWKVEAKGWADERLEVMVLQAVAHHAHGEMDEAVQVLSDALLLAETGGFIRIFVDEGASMEALLKRMKVEDEMIMEYVRKLLAAFANKETYPSFKNPQPLVDPLSRRECEVLKLLTTDLSGPEIAKELMVSMNTIRTHTKNIYSKLGVNIRKDAVRQAKELNII